MANLNGHGGSRPGAGRPPKALRYAAEIADAESKIIAALPDVIDGLIAAAKAGDAAAGRYLLDRVWGRVQTARAPWSEDQALDYTETDFADAAEDRERQREGDRNLSRLIGELTGG